jgi:hypothetical protein
MCEHRVRALVEGPSGLMGPKHAAILTSSESSRYLRHSRDPRFPALLPGFRDSPQREGGGTGQQQPHLLVQGGIADQVLQVVLVRHAVTPGVPRW